MQQINNIAIYNVEYEVKTPLDINKEYLVGSAIRGAILSRLYEVMQFNVKEESKRPSLIFHPAFPIDQEGMNVFKPAHPFIYKCKICKVIHDDTPNIYKIINEIEKNKLILPRKCNNNHPFTLKSLEGKLIANNNGKILEYKDKRVTFYSVGINKILGSAEINIIYDADYIVPGTRFRGLIVQIKNDNSILMLDELISKIDNTIFVGRGSSRGFGHIRVSIRKEEDNYINERREKVKTILKDHSCIILRALSPVFNIDINTRGLVSNYNIKVNKMKVKQIITTRHTRISGFSLLSNIQKINLSGLGEGSLVCLDINKDINSEDDIIDEVIRIELLGIGMFSPTGLNIVEVL
ncbi:MAG: hypothetical protein QW416_08435 [Candidatus Nitrosocaldaceae archaeon]